MKTYGRNRWYLGSLLMTLLGQVFVTQLTAQSCGNAIACENALTGNPQSEWDVVGAGDPNLQGFATQVSVNRGNSIDFKVSTNSSSYRIDIYRLGYYAGLGARKITTIDPTAIDIRAQTACLYEVATGMYDCGNWTISASWFVPSNAASGVYIARLVRPDTGGASHITFVVRDDEGNSDLLFQTSDTTWQAYNTYGGNSLYEGTGPGGGKSAVGRSYKVSYNRPDNQRLLHDGLFTFEYPMLRWLEANGYDVSYATGLDSDIRGAAALAGHKVFLSVGHDEYWSNQQRLNVETARAAGVHLAFFSANEVFWKTRWEPSIDTTGTPNRTMVCYKETHVDAKIDPTSAWTGTWRDPRFSPPADGGRPENALTGQIFTVINAGIFDRIEIPAEKGRLRLWRNTGFETLLDGQVGELLPGILSEESDEDLDNGFRPVGIFPLSDTSISVIRYLQDYGSLYAPGFARHTMTLYRHPSGALVFGSGTYSWSWGLDKTHDPLGIFPGREKDPHLEQATVNLFADMDVQPQTLQPGLVTATKSSDTSPPESVILRGTDRQETPVPAWTAFEIYGTASDSGGGRPATVDISTDSSTWHRANGVINWKAVVESPASGAITVRSRAVDDSGNIENSNTDTVISVDGYAPGYNLFSDEAHPKTNETDNPVELGMRFQAEADGWITAVRFYKGLGETGDHVCRLWSSNGTLLGTGTSLQTAETASGWQEVQLDSAVSITAGTSYVAAYHSNGHYVDDVFYFAGHAVHRPPLLAPADSSSAHNGVYTYQAGAFPTSSSQSANYWVDVVYRAVLVDTTAPIVTALSPEPASKSASPNTSITAKFNEPMLPSTISSSTFTLRKQQSNSVSGTLTYDAASQVATFQPSAALEPNTTYIATIKGRSAGVSDMSGNRLAGPRIWSFTTGRNGPFTLWVSTTIPETNETDNPVELGVRFQAEADGWITAVRFYKGQGETGDHVCRLWSSNGTLLGTGTSLQTAETASGWQEVQLDSAVSITAGFSYVAAYHSNGHYVDDVFYFAGHAVHRPPLLAPADSSSAHNGVYTYQAGAFPTSSSQSANYWVDVVFKTSL